MTFNAKIEELDRQLKELRKELESELNKYKNKSH